MSAALKSRPLFDPPIVRRAIVDAFKKLDPRRQVRNPVMFTVLVGSVLTTVLGFQALLGGPDTLVWRQTRVSGPPGHESPTFILGVSAWLWFTVLFANFAEAMAEGRGKAQADSLRQTRREVVANKLDEPCHGGVHRPVSASNLRNDDIVLAEGGRRHGAMCAHATRPGR